MFQLAGREIKHISEPGIHNDHTSRGGGVGHPLGMTKGSFAMSLEKYLSEKAARGPIWAREGHSHGCTLKANLRSHLCQETVRYLHQLEEQMKLKKWRIHYNYANGLPTMSDTFILSLPLLAPGTSKVGKLKDGNRWCKRERLLRIGRRSERDR